jgi:hypothetical protein
MVSFTNRPPYPTETIPGTYWIVGWIGPRIALEFLRLNKPPPSKTPDLESTPGPHEYFTVAFDKKASVITV